MKKRDIKNLRMDVGKYLHTFYVKFGEEEYDKFLDKLGLAMTKDYGESFSSDNLRIMEAEYVTFSSKINESKKNKETVKQ